MEILIIVAAIILFVTLLLIWIANRLEGQNIATIFQRIFIVILYVLAIFNSLMSFNMRPKTLEQAVIAGALFISAAILHAKERENKSKK